MLETELRAEQAHLDRAYDRLDALQAKALGLATTEWKDHAETPAALLERDVREAAGLRRYGSLRIDGGLCFGRIDGVGGETFHIGRVGVADEDMTPLVVDWRAPVAEPFYRATPLDPLGLARRRHLLTRGRRVVGIEDEPLDLDAVSTDAALVFVGEAALMRAVTERRIGRMRDIVATIQAEQDAIIRSPLRGVLVVQGGPGTGKTAVALHRAAFLLYKHRFPLEEQGVLVLGPNPLFLRYIERVLPSLGESRCRLATVDEIHRVRATAMEREAVVVALKGDGRMASVLARAVEGRERPLARREVIGIGAYRLRLGPDATGRIVEAAKARPGTHNARRPFVERLVQRRLLRLYRAAVERARASGLPAVALGDSEVLDELHSSRDVRRIVDRIWPVLSPQELVESLYVHPPLLHEAASGVLTAEEEALLARDPGSGWTSADLPLLDEAEVLLGTLPRPKRATPAAPEDASLMVDRVLAGHIPDCPACGQPLSYSTDTRRMHCDHPDCGEAFEPEEVMSPAAALLLRDLQRVMLARVAPDTPDTAGRFATYGHIVVDEAQELSAMQWRALARRCPGMSMTIVGDLDQGSGPTAARTWDDVLAALEADRERSRVVELTVNYRTPLEVMAVADRLSGRAAPARCVREAGEHPRFVATDDLLTATARAVAGELDAAHGAKVGVIAPPPLVDGVRAGAGASATTALDDDVTVVDPEAAKGLEFDSVVVVEPAAFDERALYVALTRTTTRLVIVHAAPLPAALDDARIATG